MKTLKRKKGTTLILKRIMYVTFAGLLMMQISSCTKDDNTGKASLSVLLTDAPANYDAVIVDVQGVEIKGNGEVGVMLNTTTGTLNLLDLSNGLTTLIATGDIEPGTISQIRLILGPNNYVIVDGVNYPLSTPSAMQSGLKLQIHQTFEADVSYIILLDFDASQSIVQKGNNEYQLKPVIRTIDAAITGSIKGSITPIEGGVTVSATSDETTFYSSVTNAEGKFLIAGLPSGTYVITFTRGLNVLRTLTGKTVTIGVATDLEVTTL